MIAYSHIMLEETEREKKWPCMNISILRVHIDKEMVELACKRLKDNIPCESQGFILVLYLE